MLVSGQSLKGKQYILPLSLKVHPDIEKVAPEVFKNLSALYMKYIESSDLGHEVLWSFSFVSKNSLAYFLTQYITETDLNTMYVGTPRYDWHGLNEDVLRTTKKQTTKNNKTINTDVVKTLQGSLHNTLSTTMHVYGHPTALLSDTGIAPLYIIQNLQLVQLRFRLCDSWSLSHLGHLYPGTTPVMINLDHNRSCPW